MGRSLVDSDVILKHFARDVNIEWILTEKNIYYNATIFSGMHGKTGLRPYDITIPIESAEIILA